MRIVLSCLCSAIALTAAAPAFAEDTAPPPAITINGSATVVTDYRFRGVSQTDNNAAIQGSITVAHESGFYVSVWGSSVNGYVTAAGTSGVELDLIGGFKKTFGGTTFDIGVLYYYYPKTKIAGDTSSSDFAEPYLAVSHTFGPVTAKGTVAYAPKQKALKLDQATGASRDNVYLAGDLSASIPGTPLGLIGHLGHSFGPSWLASDGVKSEYTDWSVGATATFKAITVGVSYVDTDANFIAASSGKKISNGAVVGSVGVSF
ncbi:MAG: TorF family putative porin [Sphingomonadales bacterium]